MEIVRAGRAILFRESAHAKPHLWFILTDPDGNPPRVVAVMLRTAQRFTDETVVLHSGAASVVHPRLHSPVADCRRDLKGIPRWSLFPSARDVSRAAHPGAHRSYEATVYGQRDTAVLSPPVSDRRGIIEDGVTLRYPPYSTLPCPARSGTHGLKHPASSGGVSRPAQA